MTTGLETMPAAAPDNEGGGVELLACADPPTTCVGTGPTLPELGLGGATKARAARVWRCGDPVTPCSEALMQDGGVACIGGVLDPIEDREDLLDLSALKEPEAGVLCSGVALLSSCFSVAFRPESINRAILSLSSCGEKGRPPL